MSKQMVPKTNTVNMDPTGTTREKIPIITKETIAVISREKTPG